jgi:hypothetical protein
VNGFDVHAVGWVVTRDMCGEAARTFLCLEPRLERDALEPLAALWYRVVVATREDQSALDYATRLLEPRRTPLSVRSEAAMRAFAGKLVEVCPRLYAHEALRRRCLGACGRLIASLLCFLLLAASASPAAPLLGLASVCFLLVACWSFATTSQLFAAYRLIGQLRLERSNGCVAAE